MNEATLKEAHILMVDDEVASTCLLTNFLHRIGYSRLESINDSTLTFETIERFKPDLILLDLAMPNISGFQVLEGLRANRQSEDQIPVLVLTGDPTVENKRRALAAGATDLLTKPFDPSEVNMRIRNLVQARFLRLEIREQNQLLEERVRERTCQLETALADLRSAQTQLVQQERLSAFGEMAGGVDGAHVVSRLRDFYRPRGAADLFEPLDLREIVTQSIALARPRCARRESSNAVSFHTDFEDDATAAGIGAELREVLTNLIFNALDAIPAEGVITVRTQREHGDVTVAVTDTGTGMTPEVRERCLEPFFTTKGDRGTGLGLAMVFGIIKRHQGTLEIESEPGKGTTIRLRLPACPPLIKPHPALGATPVKAQ